MLKIIGHKTGSAIYPGNSMEGLVGCYKSGAYGIECDIVFGENGEITIPQNGNKDNQKKLRIENVWDFLFERPDIKIFFDIKFYNTGLSIGAINHLSGHFQTISNDQLRFLKKKVIDPAILYGMSDRIGFVTFMGGLKLLKLAKKSDRAISTYLIVILPWLGKFPWTDFENHWEFIDAIIIGWDRINQWKFFPKSLRKIIREARINGKEAHGGLANSRKEVLWLLGCRLDGIWTDRVSETSQMVFFND